MARVRIGAQGWGLIRNNAGDAQSGVTVTITELDGTTAATVYAAATGTTTTSPVTGSDGRIAGWIDEGSYLLDVPSGVTDLQVEAARGVTVAVMAEAPINPMWPEYGAVGNGSDNDHQALQDAIDHATTAQAGGEVFLGPYDFAVENGGLTVGPNTPVRISGCGWGYTGGAFITRVKRTGTETAQPLLRAAGDGNNPTDRAHIDLFDLELNGGAIAATILELSRANESTLENVMIRSSGATGAHFKQVWNSTLLNVTVRSCGSGTDHPAAWFDAYSTAASADPQASCQTVLCSELEFEGNSGTDVRFSGNTASSPPWPTVDVAIVNAKMEAGTGSHPYIDLAFAHSCRFVSLHLSRGSGRTGPLIQQVGTNTGTAANTFSDCALSAQSGTAANYYVEHGVGSMIFDGATTVLGAPGIAFFRVLSTVQAGRFKLDLDQLVTNLERSKVVKDERGPVSVASNTEIELPNARLVSVTGTSTVNRIKPTFPGDVVTLIFPATAILTDSGAGGNLRLSSTFIASAGDTLTLICDGADWYEVARSSN